MRKNNDRKMLLWLLVICTLFSGLTAIGAQAEEREITGGLLFEETLAAEMKRSGAETIPEWIAGELCTGAGKGSEWYVLALSQSGEEYDLSAYGTALLRYLDSAGTIGAASSQKYALALIAAGKNDPFLHTALNEAVGKQGIMSWIYGLHLLNNGYPSALHTREEVTGKLLSMRLPDGGWALTGSTSDVDVTAMALQALAPQYPENQAVHEAAEGALAFLSSRMLPDGDFSGFGSSNAESTAQVLIALCSLNIDFRSEDAFLRNGRSVLDGLLRYRLNDGTFCHTMNGDYNRQATEQALLAFVAMSRMEQGKGSIYLLDSADSESLPAYQPGTGSETGTGTPVEPGKDPGIAPGSDAHGTETQKNAGKHIRLWLTLVIVGCGGVTCLILFLRKKKATGNYLVVVVVVAIALLLVWTVNIRSAGEYYGGDVSKEHPVGTVTMTIRCDTVAGRSDVAPADGVILGTVTLVLGENDTVFDLLTDAARIHGIRVESSSGYVKGIQSLYEQDFGELSGWVFRVNGETVPVGCKDYHPVNGDRIEWLYTCDLGNDLN